MERSVHHDNFPDADAVIVQPQTSLISGFCDDHLRRLEKRGEFPARFKLNPSAGPKSKNGWSRIELMRWLAERKAARDAA
jgi:predicted DNA-binding transcriptional regulator AlpA